MAIDDAIESQEVATEEATEATQEEAEEAATATEEPKAEKPKESLEQRRARLQRELKQTEKKLGLDKDEATSTKNQPSELSEDQLDYLDLKGITEQDDIDVIQKVMTRTGDNLRTVLKDDYVQAKLKENKQARAVAEATPASTRRGGAGGANIEAAIDRFEKTGEFPAGANFETKAAIINGLEKRSSVNQPAFKR